MMRNAWFVGVLAAALTTLARGCAAPERTALDHHQAARATATAITVMTFNVNFGVAGHRDNIRAIAEADADVVLLQETTPAGERAFRAALGERYAHMQFRECCNAGGLGILSKFPIVAAQYLDSPVRWFPAWRFVVDAPGGPVQLLDVHLRPPISESGSWAVGYFTTKDVRLEEVQVFGAALDPALPTIVAGDFNESEHGDAMKWLGAQGLNSVLPQFDPIATTWSWPLPLTSLRARLDHIVVGPQWEAVDAWVIDAGVSDHKPVVAVLRLR